MWVVFPVSGSSRPSAPVSCAVYQTVPSGAGATSCGCVPGGHRELAHGGPPCRGRRAKPRPVRGHHAPDEAEAAVAERAEDDRLALLQALSGRLLHDDAVRDEHGQPPLGGLRADQPPRRLDLRAPAGVVRGRDRVEERGADGGAAEREPCGLERAAVGAREHLADGQPKAPDALPDRARVSAALRGEVPLRRAVGDDDRILVLLRLVGVCVPEDEHEPARTKRLGKAGARRRARAGHDRDGREGGDGSGEQARGRHHSSFADDPSTVARAAADRPDFVPRRAGRRFATPRSGGTRRRAMRASARARSTSSSSRVTVVRMMR